jgi:hypothetical protein
MSRNESLLVLGSAAIALLMGEASARWLLPEQYRLHQTHWRHNRASASEVFDPEIGWVLANGTVDSREDAWLQTSPPRRQQMAQNWSEFAKIPTEPPQKPCSAPTQRIR